MRDWRAARSIKGLLGSRRVEKLRKRGVEVTVRVFTDDEESEEMSGGNSIKRVTESVQTFQKTIDGAADALAGRAKQLQDRTLDGLHKVGQTFDAAEAALGELEDLVGQASNFPPTETPKTE